MPTGSPPRADMTRRRICFSSAASAQIAEARPDWLEPASTAREIAGLPALPERARAALRGHRRAGRAQPVRAACARSRRLAGGARRLCRLRAGRVRSMNERQRRPRRSPTLPFTPRAVLALVVVGALAVRRAAVDGRRGDDRRLDQRRGRRTPAARGSTAMPASLRCSNGAASTVRSSRSADAAR